VLQHTRIAVLLCAFLFHWTSHPPLNCCKTRENCRKKKLNGNCCLILHRNQVVITQTSLQMYCHLTCPN
jgi:hypothetical protein